MNDDENQTPSQAKSQDSNAFGVSMRAWIAITLVITVCFTHFCITLGTVINAVVTKDFSLVETLTVIREPLYSMAVGALGYYFGQKNTATSTK